MASEQDGLLHQKEILTKKLNYLRKEYAIASDASQKFTLQMQIAEVEKEIEVLDSKIANIPSKNQGNQYMKEENPYDRWVKTLKKSWIIGVILLIFLLVTKGDEFFTAFDNLKNRFNKDSITVQTDTLTTPENHPNIDTSIITEPPPNLPTPPEKQPLSKKYISVKLIVDIAYEKATIFANNVQVYPVNDAPTVKELSIEYKGNPIELRIVTPEKTCTHHITVSEDYFKNPQTIEKICSQ